MAVMTEARRARGDGRFAFVVVESVVSGLLAVGWLLLALAMSMEAYDRVPGEPGTPEGQGGLALLALGVGVSVGVTWALRLFRAPGARLVVDGVVALRLLAVLVVSVLLGMDLLDG
ncbi:hypothetical protein [Streptomyces sp. NPDC048659]|uniref:hypothetical protein n=1 Tax=Streptomyces sp. NPDC048659 TaxID=3155489 RepID=UPI00342F2AEC